MNNDIYEYIISIIIKNNNYDFRDILKYREVCTHWNEFIYNEFYKNKINDLDLYFSAMRINVKLSRQGMNFKKLLFKYEFCYPISNTYYLSYKCCNCGKKKYNLGDYDCCKKEILNDNIKSNTLLSTSLSIFLIFLFYIIYLDFIYITVYKILYFVEILKIIIVVI